MIHDYYCLECGTKHKGGEIAFDLAEILGIDRDDYSNLGYQSMTLVSSEKLKKIAHKCGSPLKHQKSSKISISLKDFLEIIESNVNEKDRQDSFFQGYMYDINKLENAFTQLFSYVNIRKKLEIRRIAESIINTFTRKDETLEREAENEDYIASCYVKPEFFYEGQSEEIYSITFASAKNRVHYQKIMHPDTIRGYCPICGSYVLEGTGKCPHILIGVIGTADDGKTSMIVSAMDEILQSSHTYGLKPLNNVLCDNMWYVFQDKMKTYNQGWAIPKTNTLTTSNMIHPSILLEMEKGDKRAIITLVNIAAEDYYNPINGVFDKDMIYKYPLISMCSIYMLCTGIRYVDTTIDQVLLYNNVLDVINGIYEYIEDKPPLCIIITKSDRILCDNEAIIRFDNPYDEIDVQDELLYKDQISVLKALYGKTSKKEVAETLKWCCEVYKEFSKMTYVAMLCCSARESCGDEKLFDSNRVWEDNSNITRPQKNNIDLLWKWILQVCGMMKVESTNIILQSIPAYNEYYICDDYIFEAERKRFTIDEFQDRFDAVRHLFLNISPQDHDLNILKYEAIGFIDKFIRKKSLRDRMIETVKYWGCEATIDKDYSMLKSDNEDALVDDFYRAYRESDTMKVYESKVIFLGDGDVGKTYSIKRLFLDGEKETKETEAEYKTTMTHGIIIRSMEMETEDKNSFKINFWDFGGQTIMHSMHRCFLTQNSCYVIMISTRNDRDQMEQARYWLRNIQAFAKDAPVILYINRWSDLFERIDIDRLLEEFPNSLRSREHIICLNAKESNKEEFLKLRKIIVNITKSLPGYGMIVPSSWYSVRQELIRLSHDEKQCVIEQNKYQDICNQYHLAANKTIDEAEELQLQLLDWFNNIGICYSYHVDNFRQPLSKYKVLNPEWLTNAIYLLIIEGNRYSRDGILSRSIIHMILEHPEKGESGNLPYISSYNKEQCEYICEIMRKYQLSYETEEGEFIPALCGNNRPTKLYPEGFRLGNPEHKYVTYIMKYIYLPDTVIQNLMIRLKKYRKNSEFWIKGLKITLSDKGLMAIVDMGTGNQTLRIDIYTTGKVQAYEFLPELRDHLQKINEKLNLIPEEFIVAHGKNGDTYIKLTTLLRLKERGKKLYEDYDNENEYSIDELIDNVFGRSVRDNYEAIVRDEGLSEKYELYSQLIRLSQLLQYERTKESEDSITKYLIKSLGQLQDNNLVNRQETKEDQFNDHVRDSLNMIYEIKDQRRAGESVSGKGAGEIDLTICYDNKILALYEAHIVNSINTDKIKEHIDKLIFKYNPSGVGLLYYVIFVRKPSGTFASFRKGIRKYLEEYQYPYPVCEQLEEIEEEFRLMSHYKVKMSMEGKDAMMHVIVVKVN